MATPLDLRPFPIQGPAMKVILDLTNPGENLLTSDTSGTNASCRPGCGACCIAPSISSPIPGMPNGKPAGVRCVQLDESYLCRLFDDPRRPSVCAKFHFDRELCGTNRSQALERITWLESGTTAG